MALIPMPGKLGDIVEWKNRRLRFIGVSWFYWSSSLKWSYTYVFECPGNKWAQNHIESDISDCPFSFSIEDLFFEEKSIKDFGHPLTGIGRATGLFWEDGKIFVDFLITSRYYEHIRSECDETGHYNNGIVIFPKTPSYDVAEKRRKAVTSTYLKIHSVE